MRDWGSGNPDDLGDLKIESVSSSLPDASEPLYQQLAKRLETLEVHAASAITCHAWHVPVHKAATGAVSCVFLTRRSHPEQSCGDRHAGANAD